MVERICVPANVTALKLLDRVDYEDTFSAPSTAQLSPEHWARLFFDGTSPLFRAVWWALFSGLRVRSSPSNRPDHIFGWKILQSTPDAIVLGVATPVGATARLITTTPPGQVAISTVVRLDSATGRAIWPAASYGHRATVHYLLGRAVNAAARQPCGVEDIGREKPRL
jgi:hypothetical protein